MNVLHYQSTRHNVRKDLNLQLSTLFCPIIPLEFGVHIQTYHLCLSESKHKTKQLWLLSRSLSVVFFTKFFTLCRTLKKILGPKRYEVTEEWRKLHNDELFYLYCSPNIILVIKSRRVRWTGHVARMGKRRGAYMVLVGKRDRKRQLERPRCRWEDVFKTDFRDVVRGGTD